MRGPPHSGVGVGDRMPYRVNGKCGGHLQFGGPLELDRRVLRVGHRVRPPDAADVVVQAGVLQPAVSWPRIEEFLRLFRAPARGVEITAEDVNPAALQQDAMDVQRLLDLSPVPLGVAETLVGVVELLDREGDQAEVQPASRHIVRPHALGDRRIGLVRQVLCLRPIAHRPRRCRPFEFRSRRSQGPAAGFGAGTRPSQPRFGFGQPARLDAEPAVRRGAEHEEVVVELIAAVRVRRSCRSLSPTREPTARAGRRRTARWRTGCARR